MEWSRIAILVLLASCAQAGSDDDGIAAPSPDATSGTSFPDAARFPDATPMPDARPSISYDAQPAGGADAGLFCETSATCTTGECCLIGLCVTGVEVGGFCLPD